MTAPFGLYIHWPYCTRICPYCDFNVYKAKTVDEAQWVSALTASMERQAAITGPRALTSVYFGGGTPSLLSPTSVGALINAADRIWGLAAEAEITLEANPTDAEVSRLQDFAAAGVNRLSLGIQSFDDAALSFLGRNHSAREARTALDRALAHMERVTFDLIYALPDQSPADWASALESALAIGATHLSVYQLTIEPGTAFERLAARGTFTPCPPETCADMFDITRSLTETGGLPRMHR